MHALSGIALLSLSGVLAKTVNQTAFSIADNDLSADVLWDTWGVPHIFSDTEEGLALGFGYGTHRPHV